MNFDIIEPSRIGGCVLREISHTLRPTRPDLAGEGFRLSAEALEIAVFQTDARDATGKFREDDFDLRQDRRIEAKLMIELPTKDQSMGRLPHENRSPLRLSPLRIAFEPASTLPGLDYQIHMWIFCGGFSARPPCAGAPREKVKGSGRGASHVYAAFHWRDAHLVLFFS
jgi:hypothetical protein